MAGQKIAKEAGSRAVANARRIDKGNRYRERKQRRAARKEARKMYLVYVSGEKNETE